MNQKIRESVLHTWRVESEEIARLMETVDEETLEKIIDRILSSQGKIVLTGCGTSAMAAQKIVHSLRVIDIPALYLNPSDAVHGALGAVQKDDTVIFLSKGGNTAELLSFLDNVKQKGAYIISVSENEDSRLAKEADLFLKVKIQREPDPYDMLATASTMAVIAVFDAICIAVMEQKSFSKEGFALNHPGGAVGERLKDQKQQ